jgi:hypothetical protein
MTTPIYLVPDPFAPSSLIQVDEATYRNYSESDPFGSVTELELPPEIECDEEHFEIEYVEMDDDEAEGDWPQVSADILPFRRSH